MSESKSPLIFWGTLKNELVHHKLGSMTHLDIHY